MTKFNKCFNFLFSQTVKKVNSSINGEIKVVKFLGKPRILVRDMIQSGGLVESIWKKALKKIKSLVINNCLILGLGGGTVATLINQSYPKAQITGVEIDPKIIQLGKEYFDLDKIENLKIIKDDAIDFIINCQPPAADYYSPIFVDLYLGEEVPKRSESKEFLKKLKELLSTKGIVVFNRLFYRDHKQKTERFIKKLEPIFPQINLVRAWSNLLIFCNL